jgi:hypothetical protein
MINSVNIDNTDDSKGHLLLEICMVILNLMIRGVVLIAAFCLWIVLMVIKWSFYMFAGVMVAVFTLKT